MKTLAIVRIYATSWWSVLWLGGPLLLLAIFVMPQRANDEPLNMAVIGPWLLIACYCLPLRMLSLGAGRRLMPGHARAVTRLLAAIAAVGSCLGLFLAWWIGAPLPAAALIVLLSGLLGWWVLALCDFGWYMLVTLGLCAAWVFVIVPRFGLHLGMPGIALPLAILALAAFVPGWRRMVRSPAYDTEPVPMGDDATQAAPTPSPGWLSGGNRSQRRLGLQWWSPVALAVLSAVWVLAWSATGYGISRWSQDGTEKQMLRLFADIAAGWTLIAANVLTISGTDAGRQQLALLFRLPGGGRRRIARRLVDRGLFSAVEVTGALAVGGGAAWLAMVLLQHRDGAVAVRSLGIVLLAILVSMATSSLTFWLFTWRVPKWLSWSPMMGWFAMLMLAIPAVSGLRERGTAQDAWLGYFAAAAALLLVMVVTRHLAIRRLAVAEPG